MGFFLALRFLSILPIPGKAQATDKQLGRSTAWYPVVGALLGALLFGSAYLFTRFWSALPAAFLCLAVWTVFTWTDWPTVSTGSGGAQIGSGGWKS